MTSASVTHKPWICTTQSCSNLWNVILPVRCSNPNCNRHFVMWRTSSTNRSVTSHVFAQKLPTSSNSWSTSCTQRRTQRLATAYQYIYERYCNFIRTGKRICPSLQADHLRKIMKRQGSPYILSCPAFHRCLGVFWWDIQRVQRPRMMTMSSCPSEKIRILRMKCCRWD